MGNYLKRQEAVELLNELLAYCEQLNPRFISLHPSKQADDFELHIKDPFADACYAYLKSAVQKRGLSMKEHNKFLVVFTPKPEEK